MKRVRHSLLYLLAAGAMLLTGCSDDFFGDKTEQHDSNRIQLSGDIDQLAVTRVNDNGFCNGDVMGVYIVDYEGNKPGTLKVNGNRGDNVRHTFDEPNYKWNSAYAFSGKTSIRILMCMVTIRLPILRASRIISLKYRKTRARQQRMARWVATKRAISSGAKYQM